MQIAAIGRDNGILNMPLVSPAHLLAAVGVPVRPGEFRQVEMNEDASCKDWECFSREDQRQS